MLLLLNVFAIFEGVIYTILTVVWNVIQSLALIWIVILDAQSL
jgi:hypothetical protein